MNTGLFIFLFSIYSAVNGANILAVFPLPLYSHTNTFMVALKALVVHGHNITMVSPYPQKKALTNWTDIVLSKTAFDQVLDEAIRDFSHKSVYSVIPDFWKFCANILEQAYQDKTFQKFIREDNMNFDLVITEPFFAHESLVAFGHKYNAPVIGLYPLTLSAWATYMTSNPLSTFIPHFRSAYSDEMTFFERLDNTFLNILELIIGIFYYFPKQEKLMEKYMIYPKCENRPPLLDMLKNVSLHLIDYHFSVGYPHPFHPNIISIGGLTLKRNEKLSKDLQKFMDGSPKGVIYLSFGSHKPVSSLEKNELNAILMTFKNLNVKVLMKWENGSLINKPDNIEVREWFPQSAVLAHPNCRLFITHGGVHSISEAVHHGVPIVGIPFFGDQEYNMKFVESAGIGLTLMKNEITPEKFELAIKTVLYNNSFREKIIKRSMIMKDRPLSPLDTAVYWIEYALKHKDLSHLRPASNNLTLYQLFLLDFAVILFPSILILIFLVFYIVKPFLGLLFLKKSERNVTKNKTE